jgi:cytochrome c biogenesis protein CcmG/thiol:disulfide interchange protein DsbE
MKLNRFALPLAGFVMLAIVLAISLGRAPGKAVVRSALLDKPAPVFELPDLTSPGGLVSNAAFANRWYLLNVWGTWCVECRAEHAVLLDIQREGRVEIIGLDYKDEDDAALAWLAELGNPYAAVAADREGNAAIDWGVYGAPETFLVNPQGLVVQKQVGPISAEIWRRDFMPHLDAVAK